MFDTECLHSPYLPPPSGSSTMRSPALKPSRNPSIAVPEGDLLNLNDQASHKHSSHHHGSSINRDAAPSSPGRTERPLYNERASSGGSSSDSKRRTGFSKRPGSSRRKSANDGAEEPHENDGDNGNVDSDDEWEEEEWVPDLFLFEYGTVVIWGMTEKEEKAFLKSLSVSTYGIVAQRRSAEPCAGKSLR